ncbi:hypothetical protein LTR15_009104 [Elasticomyces elasticus]|nr:hypothetical protein LTR15_009104 [Elasticomyces elasticus]
MADPATGSSKQRDVGVDGYSEVKRFRPSFNNTITVLAGETKKPFIVHSDAICRSSDFFVAACKREWQEGEERTVPLPEIGPEIFTVYANWAYSGELEVEIVDSPDETDFPVSAGDEAAQTKHEHALWMARRSNLIALYIAADFLRDDALKSRTIEAVLNLRGKRHKLYMLPSLISQIWQSTAPTSGLRRVLMDHFISSKGGDSLLVGVRGQVPPDFFADLAVRTLQVHGPLREVKPSLLRRKHYYDGEEQSSSDDDTSSDDDG